METKKLIEWSEKTDKKLAEYITANNGDILIVEIGGYRVASHLTPFVIDGKITITPIVSLEELANSLPTRLLIQLPFIKLPSLTPILQQIIELFKKGGVK
jgi:hypothetical protein